MEKKISKALYHGNELEIMVIRTSTTIRSKKFQLKVETPAYVTYELGKEDLKVVTNGSNSTIYYEGWFPHKLFSRRARFQ